MSLRTSVVGIASSLIGLTRIRLELLGLEFSNKKTRLFKLLGLAFASLLFLTLAVLVFSVTIAVVFWPTENRYMALGLLAGGYAVIGLGLFFSLRHALLHDAAPSSVTIEELGRDAAFLARLRDVQLAEDEQAKSRNTED
jgi:uncharacterized membrane protein YqjE